MKVIIAGERDLPLKSTVPIIVAVKSSGFVITEVVSGNSGNVDSAGEVWAKQHKVPVKRFRPDWLQGRKAGPIRNTKMADYADALILIWTGKGRGSADILKKCQQRGLPIFEMRVEVGNNTE